MLGLAVAYQNAAIGRIRSAWAIPLTVGVTLVSLVACVLDSPAAIVGLIVDIGILAAIGVAHAVEPRRHARSGAVA